MTIKELSARTGCSPRQIRYLIAERIVPPPTGGRAHAFYGDEHLERIRRYQALRELGFPPRAIRKLLEGRPGVPFPLAPGITLIVAPDRLDDLRSPGSAERIAEDVRTVLLEQAARDGKPNS